MARRGAYAEEEKQRLEPSKAAGGGGEEEHTGASKPANSELFFGPCQQCEKYRQTALQPYHNYAPGSCCNYYVATYVT